MTSWIERLYSIGIFTMLFLMGLAGLASGLNPLDPGDYDKDPDGDGLNNLQEFLAGSDPNNYDTDGDTMSDGWEAENGLDPGLEVFRARRRSEKSSI